MSLTLAMDPATGLSCVDGLAETQDVVDALRRHFGVHVTYHPAQGMDDGRDIPVVRSTYPKAWLGHYLVSDYISVDPVVIAGFQRALPFSWTELTLTEAAMSLMKDAIAFGLEPNGHTWPVTDKQGRRAIFSINGAGTPVEWARFIETHQTDFAEIAQFLHTKAIKEIFGDSDPKVGLTAREIECLGWTARGKSAGDIGVILDISVHTVRQYLKGVRNKLDCSSIQSAVREAARLRIISTP